MEHITIYPGYDKNRRPEAFSPLTLQAGELCAIEAILALEKAAF